MLAKLRSYRPSHATIVAYLALFVALGGSSYAALRITSRNVPANALTGADIKKLTGKDVTNNSLTGADVKNLGSGDVANGKLLAEDFQPGQLPSGAQGPPGPKGDTGTVDTSAFYPKSDSDSRFLGINGQAADSQLLDGLDSSAFLRNLGGTFGTPQGQGPTTAVTIAGHGELQGACANPAQPTVSWKNTSGSDQRLFVDDGGASATHIYPLANGASGGAVTGSPTEGVADHVTYRVRDPGFVSIDVFDTISGTFCLFNTFAYGG